MQVVIVSHGFWQRRLGGNAGIIPALRGTRFGPADSLKEGSHAAVSRGGLRIRSLLVVLQVAISLTLLAGAVLLIVSFIRPRNVDPGFWPEGSLLAEVQLPPDPLRVWEWMIPSHPHSRDLIGYRISV